MTVPCRAVSPEEVAQYQANGWAKLSGLIAPEAVQALLRQARARMGDDGAGNAVSPMPQPFFNPEVTGGLSDPLVRNLLDGLGRAAVALMQRRAGIGARYFGDFFAPKLPAARPTEHSGAGATFFHQDFMNWAVDRSGGMTFWVALEDLVPDSGTMSFYSGSHLMGALGHYRSHGEAGILADFPELARRCRLDGPVAYKAGDATVHSNLTVHGTGENLTDRPRWAWIAVANPSDVRWNGGPPEAFDTSGMTMLQPLDDERFPLLG